MKGIKRQQLEKLTFFTFSPAIAPQTLIKYDKIVKDFIKRKRQEKNYYWYTYEYQEIMDSFVEQIVKTQTKFYFYELRPFITKTPQTKFTLFEKGYGKKMIKPLQPYMFENLQKLFLAFQFFTNIEWISFLHMPNLVDICLPGSYITMLKPMAKCLWSKLELFGLYHNIIIEHQISYISKTRFRTKESQRQRKLDINIHMFGKVVWIDYSFFKLAQRLEQNYFNQSEICPKAVINAMDRKMCIQK